MTSDRPSFWKRIESIDRRFIYGVILLAVLLPILFPINFPVAVTPEVQAVYDRMEALQPGDVIMLACEYDPSLRAEMEPMTYSLLRHAYRRGAKVVGVCLFTTGVDLIRQELDTISEEMGKKYGEDYLFLGYKPYPAIVINAMGLDFRTAFPKDDVEKKELDVFPIMKGIKNYGSLKFVMTVNATSGVDFWLQYGREPYQFPLGFAVAAVMATDYYSQLHTKQIFGMIGGMKGAAEYESLIGTTGDATRVMNIQSVVHVVIVGLVLLVNIAYFLSGGRMKKGGRA